MPGTLHCSLQIQHPGAYDLTSTMYSSNWVPFAVGGIYRYPTSLARTLKTTGMGFHAQWPDLVRTYLLTFSSIM